MKNLTFAFWISMCGSSLFANDIELVNYRTTLESLKDVCSITYTITETSNGTATVSEYTLTAETCEEVKAIAVNAGIIKSAKK
jgi:hypothetical protein